MLLRSTDAKTFDLHDARFHSYVAPRTGSTRLCAWRTELAPGAPAQPHTVSEEEVFLVLAGRLAMTVDEESYDAGPGDVVHVPAGATIVVANAGDTPLTLWVTTSVGIRATLPDGSQITPPWSQ
ncbi:cupin domain-containing protein [Luteipulveratus sp. YIM 133132]|uniref:cupin domain-containing protein n=1 Tax=Luteipulveratus flavus TaxID=3031728 RepID=UPI0023AF649C|nr:cupin domain-containing protein [Luteipulveratus sp. YIM 133132]MDE9367260.1 cupin domain-containing protein [Luteipulveratus sp. YIM 133132]